MGKIINLVTYCLLMFVVGKCYYAFRHSGGLRGMGKKSGFLEDQILDKIVKNGEIIAVKTAEAVDQKLHGKKDLESNTDDGFKKI